MAPRRTRRPPLPTLARRWLAVAAVFVVGYLYYHPLQSWLQTRHELAARRSEVAQLKETKRELQQRLAASTSLDALGREARRLGFVRPGEHLFIVKGIDAWRRAHSTIEGDG